MYFICMLFALHSIAQPFNSKQIDSLVELTLKTFNVPGIAVGIVKDGKLGMRITVALGRGYRPANNVNIEGEEKGSVVGKLLIDATFTNTSLFRIY